MNAIYNTGIRLYSLAARLVALRSAKVKKMLKGQKATLASKPAEKGYDVWFHAASLGEFEQARPMIERLKRERPETTILLTFFSPSGYEVRKNYDKVDAVAYLPFDTPAKVKKFLDAYNPRMAVFVKYEFWGNYMQQIHERGIPVYLISGIFRPSQSFFKWYGGMMRGILKNFDKLYLQDEPSKRLLSGIGIDNTEVLGDTRFDRVTDVMRTTVEFPVLERWLGADKALIAGSSWQPDEGCYVPYLNAHPGLKAIIAPHEFDDERLAIIQKSLKGKSILFSEAEKTGEIPSDVQTVIIDSFGKLSSLYRYGKLAIIGGGFGAGIHNINEAAVYGIPVIFGPNNKKFKEAADLKACGGGFEYTDGDTLAQILDSLLATDTQQIDKAGKAAGKYISEHIGATDKIYAQLFG